MGKELNRMRSRREARRRLDKINERRDMTVARLNLDPVRDSVNKATDAMFGYVRKNEQ